MGLKPTSEKHLWKVVQVGGYGREDQAGGAGSREGQDFGYLAVYVDDILFATRPDHTAPLVEASQGVWKCSPAEFVTTGASMRFCGFELSMEDDGAIRLSQEGFMREVHGGHSDAGGRSESTNLSRISVVKKEFGINHDFKSFHVAMTSG